MCFLLLQCHMRTTAALQGRQLVPVKNLNVLWHPGCRLRRGGPSHQKSQNPSPGPGNPLTAPAHISQLIALACCLQAEGGRGQEQPIAPSGSGGRGGRSFGRNAGFGRSGGWNEDGAFGGGRSMGSGGRRDDFGMDDLLMEVGCQALLGVEMHKPRQRCKLLRHGQHSVGVG